MMRFGTFVIFAGLGCASATNPPVTTGADEQPPSMAEETPAPPAPEVAELRWVELFAAMGTETVAPGPLIAFQDADAVWRCGQQACTRRSLDGTGEARSVALPCAMRFRMSAAHSANGRYFAQLCSGHVFVTDLSTGDAEALSRADVAAGEEFATNIAVDDVGVVTTVQNMSSDNALLRVSRYSNPDIVLDIDATVAQGVQPGSGDVLAWSDSDGHHEHVWWADGTTSDIEGRLLVNGDQIWVSWNRGGYAFVGPSGTTDVDGHICGAYVPHGGLSGILPWGPTSLLDLYERIVVLRNPQLGDVAEILLQEEGGDVGSGPTGTWLHHRLRSGGVLIYGPLQVSASDAGRGIAGASCRGTSVFARPTGQEA